MSSLVAGVSALLLTARSSLVGSDEQRELADLAHRLEGPVRVALAGRTKAGKSTLTNALVGERLAPTDAAECTRVPFWFRHASVPGVTGRVAGREVGVRFARTSSGLAVDPPAGIELDDVERFDVGWPTPPLRHLVLVDTPGLGSATTDLRGPGSVLVPTDTDTAAPVDAVVYLMRHLHRDDAAFLDAFQASTHGRARSTPVNAVAVLSRADEVGGGALDAMVQARRVCADIAARASIRSLCSEVIPVAGLLAQAGAALDDSTLDALRRVAAMEPARRDHVLAAATRFVDGAEGVGLGREERHALLDRLGLFGVRWGVAALGSHPHGTTAWLAGAMEHASGLDELRAAVHQLSVGHGRVLVARSVLARLREILERSGAPAAAALLPEVERVASHSPELAQLGALAAVRTGSVTLTADEAGFVERLLARPDLPWADRLGVDPAAPLANVVPDLVDRWRRRAEHPLTDRDQEQVAITVIRTLEGVPR